MALCHIPSHRPRAFRRADLIISTTSIWRSSFRSARAERELQKLGYPPPWIDLAVHMQITKTTIKHNVFCLLVILLSYLSASACLEAAVTEADSPGGEVAPVLENIVPNGHGPPTGRPWSGHVDRSSHFLFSFRFLCEFCTLQMPICHDLAPVMASG